MTYTFNIIKLSRKEEYLHWKTLIESFADDENSEEILYGSITLANATELLNKKDPCPERNGIETIKTADPHVEVINAQNIFKKKNKNLFNALISSISTNIFNSIAMDVVVTRIAADLYKEICKLFAPGENLEELQIELLNRRLTYGEDAQRFFNGLKKLFNKLQKLDSTVGENSLKYRALQTIPNELETTRLRLLEMYEGLDYDDLVKEIVESYDQVIQFDRLNKITSINQTTHLEPEDKHNDKSASKKGQARRIGFLCRLDTKLCSYCLENNYRLPRTHSDNECGHLHPELKEKHKSKSDFNGKFEKRRDFNNPGSLPSIKKTFHCNL